MPIRDDPSPLIDIRRGDRAYLRAADIIAAAPRYALRGPVRFRFQRVADRAGRWVSGASGDEAATMAARSSGGIEWGFRLEQPALPLRPAADLDKQALLRGAIHGSGAHCRIHEPAMVWDQIILLVRSRWEGDFPAGRWAVACIDFFDWPVAPPPPGALLSVDRAKLRRRALEVDFAFDGKPVGSMLFSIAVAALSDGE